MPHRTHFGVHTASKCQNVIQCAKPAGEIVLVKRYRHALTCISTLHGAAKSILIREKVQRQLWGAAREVIRGGQPRRDWRGRRVRGQGLAQGQGDSRLSVQGGLHLHHGLGPDQ